MTVPRVGYRLVGDDRPLRQTRAPATEARRAALPDLGGDRRRLFRRRRDGRHHHRARALPQLRRRRPQLVLRLHGRGRRRPRGRAGARRPVRAARAACGAPASGCGSPPSWSTPWPARSSGRRPSTGRWPTSSSSRTASPRGGHRVEPQIQAAEIGRFRRERPRSVAAYDIYLQALAAMLAETEAGERRGLSAAHRGAGARARQRRGCSRSPPGRSSTAAPWAGRRSGRTTGSDAPTSPAAASSTRPAT